MNWIDKIRNWDYDLNPIFGWLADIVEFHVQRNGWPAYVAIGAVVITAGLAFKPTRTATSFLLTSVVSSMFTYLQIVISLVTVHVLGGFYKLILSSFHRARNWVKETVSKRD